MKKRARFLLVKLGIHKKCSDNSLFIMTRKDNPNRKKKCRVSQVDPSGYPSNRGEGDASSWGTPDRTILIG